MIEVCNREDCRNYIAEEFYHFGRQQLPAVDTRIEHQIIDRLGDALHGGLKQSPAILFANHLSRPPRFYLDDIMNYLQPASLGWGFCRFVETSCLNPPQFLAAGIEVEPDSPRLRTLVPNAQDNIT